VIDLQLNVKITALLNQEIIKVIQIKIGILVHAGLINVIGLNQPQPRTNIENHVNHIVRFFMKSVLNYHLNLVVHLHLNVNIIDHQDLEVHAHPYVEDDDLDLHHGSIDPKIEK
jgi:hypothetical protein